MAWVWWFLLPCSDFSCIIHFGLSSNKTSQVQAKRVSSCFSGRTSLFFLLWSYNHKVFLNAEKWWHFFYSAFLSIKCGIFNSSLLTKSCAVTRAAHQIAEMPHRWLTTINPFWDTSFPEWLMCSFLFQKAREKKNPHRREEVASHDVCHFLFCVFLHFNLLLLFEHKPTVWWGKHKKLR